MGDYQPTKNNPYVLPGTLYKKVLHIIRDYPRMKDEYHEILHGGIGVTLSHTGSQGSGKKTSSTERTAIRLSGIGSDMQAVEQALFLVPQEYRDGVMDNVVHGMRFPETAGRSTYWRWRQKFMYFVADNMRYV